jgi:type II secretory pathway pseudopilin PulG
MAIQPIDLQVLFTQVDKVGKAQAAQQEGLAQQQAMKGVQLQQKTDENIRQVNEAQNTGEGTEKVNDRNRRNASGGGSKKDGKHDLDGEDEDEKTPSVFADPLLGKKIDISL